MVENIFDPDNFDDSNKINIEDFTCSICTFIPNPNCAIEEQNCSHLFCKKCIEDWLKKSNKCPICKNVIKQRNIKEDNKLIFRTINSLIIHCENCDWKGSISEYENHKKKGCIKKEKKGLFVPNHYYEVNIHVHPLLCIADNTHFDCSNKSHEKKNNKNNKSSFKFICAECNYFLCKECVNKNLIKEIKPIKIHENINYIKNNYYDLLLVHKHPLKYLDYDKKSTWTCDGTKLYFNCVSKIKDKKENNKLIIIKDFDYKTIQRFYCNYCNFNLCKKCVEAYFNLGNYKNIKEHHCIIY
jgi:hypothetical protein